MSNTTGQIGVKPPTRIELKITSDPANLADVRRKVESFCQQQGLDEIARGEVGLCVNEAMANVTRHAYQGAIDRPVVVTAETIKDGVQVSIRDWGNGFNPATVQPRPHDPMKPGGVGLICLRKMMDETVYEPQPDGMLLRMIKYNR